MEQWFIDAGWPRRVVETTSVPKWADTQSRPNAWLLLDGTSRSTIENEVRDIAGAFSYHWIWRGTPLEYSSPGYRHGPMLVALSEDLMERFLFDWGPKQVGLITFGPEQPQPMLRQIRKLYRLLGADGHQLTFHISNLRILEELCEALAADRLAVLFGPIERLLWHSGNHHNEWLQIQSQPETKVHSDDEPSIRLTAHEETALNTASRAWFIRQFEQSMNQRFPILAKEQNQPRIRRQYHSFIQEADRLGLHLERDRRIYMELRLRYPQEPFTSDKVLLTVLFQTDVQGMQRLIDVSDRLRQTVDTLF